MVQKVVGSIPITHPISECSTAVSIQVFQTWDESSILSTRTRTKKKERLRSLFFGRLYEKICEAKLLAPGYKKKSTSALIFYDRPYEKIYETKLLALGRKKEVLNLFFFIGRRRNRRWRRLVPRRYS